MKKILIVDDLDFNRKFLTKKLCYKEGKKILAPMEAENIHQAVEMAQTLKPDIIITDINLPDGNGFQLAQIIKKFNPVVPFVYITAYSLEPYLDLIKQHGISKDIIFTKPYDIPTLRTVIYFFTGIED